MSSGSDVVDWLFHHVEGFADRREARKYASNLLKAGYIRHTVNKITFSEQCYYVFGDLCGSKWTPKSSLSSNLLGVSASISKSVVLYLCFLQLLQSRTGQTVLILR